jgi:periplasmic copper chaperone A
MAHNGIRRVVGGALAVSALLTAGCASSNGPAGPMADNVTVQNQWASSADAGMTAVFGTVANTGRHDARIVGGESPVAGHVEVHEVVPDGAGGTTMQPKDGGLVVPAGTTRELIPGGDHLMLMDLVQPLQPGADIAVTVVFADGSRLPITAQIRDFAGGNEEYRPGDGSGAPHHHG